MAFSMVMSRHMVVRIRESHSFLQLCFVWEKCWNGIHDQGNLIKTWWFISLLDWFCISHIASLNKCNHAKIKDMAMHCFLNWCSCYIYQNCKHRKLYISCTPFILKLFIYRKSQNVWFSLFNKFHKNVYWSSHVRM